MAGMCHLPGYIRGPHVCPFQSVLLLCLDLQHLPHGLYCTPKAQSLALIFLLVSTAISHLVSKTLPVIRLTLLKPQVLNECIIFLLFPLNNFFFRSPNLAHSI